MSDARINNPYELLDSQVRGEFDVGVWGSGEGEAMSATPQIAPTV